MKILSKVSLILLFLSFTGILKSQQQYEKEWKNIEMKTNKGLFQSVLPDLILIQKKAQKDNNIFQLIKALKNEFEILNVSNHDEQNNEVSKFYQKLEKIEHSLNENQKLPFAYFKKELLENYFEQEYWKINQRTSLGKEETKTLETWTKKDFKTALNEYYNLTNTQERALKKVSLQEFKPLFVDQVNLTFFSSFWELVQWDRINFLKNTQIFTPNEIKDNQKTILSIYNSLIQESFENTKLYLLHQKYIEECGRKNCKDLQPLIDMYQSPIKGDYKVIIAENMISFLIHQKKKKEALEWIQKVKKDFANSSFLNNIKNLENNILQSYINLSIESVVLPNKPIQLLASHENVKNFSVHIYQVKNDIEGFMKFYLNSWEPSNFTKLNKTLFRKETFELPLVTDFEPHKTAFEIKPLPAGLYVAEYLVDGEVRGKFNFLSSESRWLTKNKNLKYASSGNLILVNRNDGKVISNETFDLFEFDNQSQKTTKTLLKTNEKGIVNINFSQKDRYYKVFLTRQQRTGDVNMINLEDYPYDDDYNNKQKEMSQVFLDRKIYRPGQKVYYKIISKKIDETTKKEVIFSNKTLEVSLFDVNGKELSTEKHITNNFGSAHGSFVLPIGKLNGSFTIKVNRDEGSAVFSVEEYKQPKFEVTFDTIKEEYKYGKEILVKGKVVTFSGVPLGNTVVNYEVKKQNIRWKYFGWFSPVDNDNENSILGEVKTNEKGEFSIALSLQKDETLEGIQIDQYNIEATVMDINGETQSSETQFRVASVSHFLSISDVKREYFSNDIIKILVEARNYNNQIINKKYSAKLLKFSSQNKVYRENFSQEIQDFPIMSRADFEQKFPNDYYSKADKKEALTLVWDKKEQSNNLNIGSLSPGKYKLQVYNVEDKDTIKSEEIFEVFDKSKLTEKAHFLKVVPEKKEYNRTEKARFYVYSSIPEALVNVYIQNGKGETSFEQKSISNGVLVYECSLPEDESIPFLNVQFQLVAFNDVQTISHNVKITSVDKSLNIEFLSFRDKLQPNSKEKWSLRISAKNGEKVNAEVLANMYDKSLDQFAKNYYHWDSLTFENYESYNYAVQDWLNKVQYYKQFKYLTPVHFKNPYFNWFDDGNKDLYYRSSKSSKVPSPVALASFSEGSDRKEKREVELNEAVIGGFRLPKNNEQEENVLNTLPVRKNLNETAFFYPHLVTDQDGMVTLEFTSPEALTQWKLMLLAHTKDGKNTYSEKTVVTQKELSVTPNYPRFLREGDELVFKSKISNLGALSLNGNSSLQILDATTMKDISSKFNVENQTKAFQLKAEESVVQEWKLKVPQGISSIIIKTMAKAGDLSDGEQKLVSILPNKILVTDTVPIFVKQGETKTFTLENLKNNTSSTVQNVSNTLELTSNPVWQIIFALPSLKNENHQSADAVFNKWFADVLASEIFKSNPKIKSIFEEYQSKALLSSELNKNQEMKQLLLEETPWIFESENEEQQMKKLSLLFDMNTMKNSIQNDWQELQKLQNLDGGFSWYSGYPSSYFSSLYILKKLGKINEWLKGEPKEYQQEDQKQLVEKLIAYVDKEVNRYLNPRTDNVWSNYILNYLDARSYWEKDFPLTKNGKKIKGLMNQKSSQVKPTDFTFYGLHRAALLFDAYTLKAASKKLITYLKETAVKTENQGVYWKKNLNEWGWHNSKIVNHAGALEAFSKLTKDTHFIEEMKIWLATQKEVSSWDTSRSTAEVIFTFLNSGESWVSEASNEVKVNWGGKEIMNPDDQATGYIKSSIGNQNIDKNLAAVTVTKSGAGIAQGGLFWQYYEDINKVKSTENYLSITRELYKKIKTINGEELVKITDQEPLKIGDKVTVRMILNADRPMEFVHLKDMRAAGFEPLDVISGYHWKNNLGYYQVSKDASTNFYIEYMPKGKFVFEYDYVCNVAGFFSNGFATLQNYYAPKMNARSEGNKVEIKD